MNSSINSLQIPRTRGSSFFIASGVNGGSSSCLAGLWCGGSVVIGGVGWVISGRTLRTTTRRDEKLSVSYEICFTAS